MVILLFGSFLVRIHIDVSVCVWEYNMNVGNFYRGLGGAASTGGRKRAQLKRFLIYSAYAWGFALLVTTLAVGADHTDAVARQLRPNIAIDSVWFQRRHF